MTPYLNLNGDSNIISYEVSATSIHVVFASGTWRNHLYDDTRPGLAIVNQMKALAAQGHGLNSFISKSVKTSCAQKW